MTEPGSKTEMTGYAEEIVKNKRYFAKLRIEKLDAETGENILHDGAVFALYRAERNEGAHGDGSVKRYDTDTIISGSQPFLVAMGAKNITSFARFVQGLFVDEKYVKELAPTTYNRFYELLEKNYYNGLSKIVALLKVNSL